MTIGGIWMSGGMTVSDQWLDECIPWGGKRDGRGRPVIGSKPAHRVIWEEVNETKLPPKVYIHRWCGTRECMNPRHMFTSQFYRWPIAISRWRKGQEGGKEETVYKKQSGIPIGY